MYSDTIPEELLIYLDKDVAQHQKYRWIYIIVDVVIALLFLLTLYVDRLEVSFIFFGMLIVIMLTFHRYKNSNKTILEIRHKTDIGKQS